MVIVVMSSNPRTSGDLARRLAATLGWPCVDATSSVTVVRDAVTRAHDRREHIVIWSSVLSRADRLRAIGAVPQVRVVQAGEAAAGPSGWREDDAALAVDVEADPDGAISAIRHTFGL
jgi:hypothetical protein